MPDDMFAPLSASETASAPTPTPNIANPIPIVPVPGHAPPLRPEGLAKTLPVYNPKRVAAGKKPNVNYEPSGLWPYPEGDGSLLGYVLRLETKPKKTFVNVQWCRLPDGGEGWAAVNFAEPHPLYGLDRLAARLDVPILVTEGEKSADAAAKLFPDLVVITSPGGSKVANKADWSSLKGRRIFVWPDHDEPGHSYADDVARLALAAGAVEIRIVAVPDHFPDRWDLADQAPEGANLRAVLDAATPWLPPADPAPEAKPERSPLFRTDKRGVTMRDDDGRYQWLCSPLNILAETRDTEGKNHGRLLEIETTEGQRHRWAMPMALLAGDGTDYRRELLRLGLRMAPGRWARDGLHTYISMANPGTRTRCVDRTGWHGRYFVAADRTYGDAGGEEVLLQVEGSAPDLEMRGTLDGWKQEVAAPAVGNSRLVLSIAAAFAGPLLYLLGDESGGLHFVGGSSIGKTTTLRLAASVWGCEVHSWRTTDNAAEALARGASDAVLCLDEIGQSDPRAADALTYMLGNGSGKARMRRDATARPTIKWRLLFVSTGETGLAAKLAETGRNVRAGQTVRLIEIPGDTGRHGVFEDLHGSKSGAAFADRLRLASETHRGHAARVFLDAITARVDGLADAVREGRRRWLDLHLPVGADGQVARVAARFGLVAAAGELASAIGILPWPAHEAERAAATCFRAWIDARGGNGPAEVAAGIGQVRGFLEAHGMSRFQAVWSDDDTDNRPVISRVGFRRKADDGRWEYFVMPEGFREITKGHNSKMLASELIKAGMLAPAGDGKSAKPVKVPGHGTMKLYHFPAEALSDGGACA
ncbi:MAG: DUF927 domain-containing protein [Azospirillum sp.]|nr:DUF927 domain-containing protein [Azospirillum sp.]